MQEEFDEKMVMSCFVDLTWRPDEDIPSSGENCDD
jgi:hypothetical protein